MYSTIIKKQLFIQVVENTIKVLPKHDFIWAQFHRADSLGEGDKQADVKVT